MIISQPKELIGAFVNVKQGVDPSTPWGNCNALGLIRGGRLVCGVIYNNFVAMNCDMHIGADSGARWMTRDFLFAAFDYPFNQLGLRRVTAKIRSSNTKAIEFVKHLGFKHEGRMRNYFSDADAVIYGMLRDQCRFLDMRKAA